MITRGFEKDLIITRGLSLSELRTEIIRQNTYIAQMLLLKSVI